MEKALAGLIAGIFIGALTVEVLNRKNPDLTKGIEKKAKNAVDAVVDAFKEGYETEQAPA